MTPKEGNQPSGEHKVHDPQPYLVLIGSPTPGRQEELAADFRVAAGDHPLITPQTSAADSLGAVLAAVTGGMDGGPIHMVIIPEGETNDDPRWTITTELLTPFFQQAIEAGHLSHPLEQYLPSEHDKGLRNIWYRPSLASLGLSHAIVLRLLGFRGRIVLSNGRTPWNLDIVRSTLWGEYQELHGVPIVDGYVEQDTDATVSYGFYDKRGISYLPTGMRYTPELQEGPNVRAFKSMLSIDIPPPRIPASGLLEGSSLSGGDAAKLVNNLIQQLASRIDLITIRRVVDAGCGEGDDLRELAKHLPDAELIGIDAKEYPSWRGELPPNISLRQGDVNYLDLCGIPDGSIDLILMDMILDQYFGVWGEEDRAPMTISGRFFEEVTRVVRDGGFVYVSDFSADKLTPIMSAKGFNLVNTQGGYLYRKVPAQQ